MGFWSTFLSEQKCRFCGGFNTVRLDDEESNELANKLYYTWKIYGGVVKKAYRCKDCGQYIWHDDRDQCHWTVPKQ